MATAATVPAPGSSFARNPIFNRELLTLLRSKKAFVFLTLYLAISIGVILASWPRETTTLLLQGAVSREIFAVFAVGQMLLLALLIPATLGSCMTSEKEGETLDLLLTTPVTADQIVVGKLMSGLVYFLILEVVSIPVLLLCFVIGGLSWEDVVGLYVCLLCQAVLFALTSVNCSIYFHRTHIAVIFAYVFVGVEAAIVNSVYGDGIDFLRGGCAPLAIGSAVAASLLYGMARTNVRKPYTPVRKSMEEEDVAQTAGLIIRRDHYPDKLIVPPRRTTLLPDRGNPVLDKELQAEIYGSGSQFIRWVIQLGVVLSLVAFFWVLLSVVRTMDPASSRFTGEHPEYVFFCFIIGYIMILSPSIATTTFSNEKEQHTIESLVLTLIPRRQIVTGKFWAIFRVVGSLTALNCVVFMIVVVLSSHRFTQMLALAMLVVSTTAFTTALGMYLSLACRRTLSATISTYFALFALFIGPVLLESVLTRLIPTLSPEDYRFIGFVSPFLASRLTEQGGEAAQMLTMTAHTGLALVSTFVLTWLMAWRFERILQKQANIA